MYKRTLRELTADGFPTGEPAAQAHFDLLREELAGDLERGLAEAVERRVVFAAGVAPLAIFRAAVGEAVRDVREHRRGQLLARFVGDGPYEHPGPIPDELAGQRLTDEETAEAIRFVHSFMVNTFKGHLAELLVARPVARIVDELRRRGEVPETVRVLAGDLVRVRRRVGEAWARGADFHLVTVERRRVRLWGVVEVKSFPLPRKGLDRQLAGHVERAARGLEVEGRVYEVGEVEVGGGVVWIEVGTERWSLPREYWIEEDGLHQPAVEVPVAEDRIEEVAPGRWRVVLRWSREALAEAALEMTFWFMGKVGEVRFAEEPSPWEEMTPEEAGRNAVKMMLYRALRRAPEGSLFERQAIALYNAYGFGYSLGMNFVGPGRRRGMLWFEDLREIHETGRTRDGGRIRGWRARDR